MPGRPSLLNAKNCNVQWWQKQGNCYKKPQHQRVRSGQSQGQVRHLEGISLGDWCFKPSQFLMTDKIQRSNRLICIWMESALSSLSIPCSSILYQCSFGRYIFQHQNRDTSRGADGVFFSWTSQIRCPYRIKRQKSEEGCNDLINKNIYFFAKGMHTMHRSAIYAAVQCLAYRSLK